MSVVRSWARRCGGEPASRTSFVMPGPGHSPKDRSLSVMLSPTAPGSFRVHSFAGDDWQACRDHVASLLGMPPFDVGRHGDEVPVRPANNEILRAPRDAETPRLTDTSDVAALLWRRAAPLVGTLGERYLREVRGVRCALPPTMRFLPAHGRHSATIVTAFALPNKPEPETIDMDGVPVRAIHLIRLAPDGTKLEKRFLGSPAGLPLVLAPPTETGRGLVVAEGIEDALSGHDATGVAAWASGSAAHLAKLAPMVPSWCETVMIMEDDNDAGRTATRTLADALARRGLEVFVVKGRGHG